MGSQRVRHDLATKHATKCSEKPASLLVTMGLAHRHSEDESSGAAFTWGWAGLRRELAVWSQPATNKEQ